MNRGVAICTGLVVLASFCWAFPPLRIHSLKAVRSSQASGEFNLTSFVADFWRNKLLSAAQHATDATEIVAAISAAPKGAREKFGRSVEIGSTYYFFLRGAGRIVSVSEDSVGLSLKQEGNAVDISVPLGLVFGNALRDGTGLLNSSDYPNSQRFNDISAGLNHTVETEVLPKLQSTAKPGRRVQFAGCVEVADEDQDLKPLKLVPIYIKTE